MKVAIITDSHWGARNDSQVFTDYFAKFYKDIFFPTLEEREIHTIIHMGDIVDRRKFINYKTLFQMRKHFFDVCYDRYIDLHLIIGNHDTYFKNTNDVNSMDCLRMMRPARLHSLTLREGAGITTYQTPTEIELDGLKCFMQPWICPENEAESLDMIAKTDAQILFGHLQVRGFEMHRGQYNYEGTSAAIFKKFDMAFSGHFHHKSDNGNVYYLGTPYQITWSDYKDPRGFHIFDTETRSLEFIQNPQEIFHKYYYDEDKLTLETIENEDYAKYKDSYVKLVVVKRNNAFWFDTLLDKLYKADVTDISVVENFDIDDFDGEELIDEAEDTMTILSKFVQSMEIEQKSELDTLMTSLYTESLTMETV